MRSHYLVDMENALLLVDADRGLLSAPVTAAVRSSSGDGVALGVLVAMFDVVASDPAMAACPEDWIATRDLSLHSTGAVIEGPVLLEARTERVGRTGVIVTGTVYDAHGRDDLRAIAADPATRLTPVAVGTTTFARMARGAAPGMDDYRPGDWIGELRAPPEAAPGVGTLYDRMGLRFVDRPAGQVELDNSSYVINSIGTITGGAQAALAEVAAEAVCPGLVAVDMQLHFLAQVRKGPVRSVVDVVRQSADHGVVNVRLVDAGDDNRLLTLVSVTLVRSAQRPPG